MADEGRYFNIFPSGFFPNRTPLSPPIDRGEDAAWDGNDVFHNNKLLWQKRPGWVKFDNNSLATGDIPKTFFSFVDGTQVRAYVDLTTKLQQYIPSFALVATKSAVGQSFMRSVKNTLYASQINNASPSVGVPLNGLKKIGSSPSKDWGINAPPTAPCVTPFSSTGARVRVGWKYVYVYKDSTDGHISSASPASDDTLNFLHRQVRVCGNISTEPRVTHVDIYRTRDGGSTFFFLTSITNTVNGTAGDPCGVGTCNGQWMYIDTTPDDKLNEELIAPINGANDPPPSGLTTFVYHEGRFWGASGTTLFYSAANIDSLVNGIPEESWPPLNNFAFPSTITGLASTTQGLLVFLNDSTHIITGHSKLDFNPDPLRSGIGVANQNCIAADGNILYLYTTQGQVLRVSDKFEDIGDPLGSPILSQFPVNNSWIAVHRSKDISTFHISTTGKMITYNIGTQTWSPIWNFASPVGLAVGSIQTSLTSFDLLLGKQSGVTGFILKSDQNTFTDDSVSYSASVVFGNLVLAAPGQLVNFKEAFLEYTGATTNLAVLPQEIAPSGVDDTFFTLTPVPEPPQLPDSLTYNTKRFYIEPLTDSNLKKRSFLMRHLQVKVDFGTSNFKQELLGLGCKFESENN